VEGKFCELRLLGVLGRSHGPRCVIRPIGHPAPGVILPSLRDEEGERHDKTDALSTGDDRACGGVACAVALSAVSEKAEATFPGKNGHITYSATDGNDKDIYTINPNGRGKVPATKNDTGDSDPSYSPNGKRIAYAGWDGHNWEIYTIDARGGSRIQITKNGTDDTGPDYSPSGKRIAFSGVVGNVAKIYTVSVRGGSKFQVTKNRNTNDYAPSYSPNGKNLAYAALAATAANDQDIYTINVGGGGRVQVTKNGAGDFSPSWGSQ
jgi:Tol biopolymer transport system component